MLDRVPHILDLAQRNSALIFDGVNSFAQVASPNNLTMTSTMTMEAWINLHQVTATSQIIVNKEGEYEMGILADGTLGWAFANGAPGWSWISTGYVVNTDAWTHVAVTYNSGVVTAYVNGAAVSTYNGSGVIGDVPPGAEYAGYPAMPRIRWLRGVARAFPRGGGEGSE